jgi:hypothetical protein
LRQKKYISFFTASFFVLVLLLANTPKQWLHYWLANHTDMPAAVAMPKNGAIVHTVGYSCDVNNVVVIMPYLPAVTSPSIFTVFSHTPYQNTFNESIVSSTIKVATSRGPPVKSF